MVLKCECFPCSEVKETLKVTVFPSSQVFLVVIVTKESTQWDPTPTKRNEHRKQPGYKLTETQQKSILSSTRKVPLKEFRFCLAIIEDLNRIFFQFRCCNHSRKHVLIENASWEFWLSQHFSLGVKGAAFFFHFMQNYSNWCLTFLIRTVKHYAAGSFHRINYSNYGYLTKTAGHKQRKNFSQKMLTRFLSP